MAIFNNYYPKVEYSGINFSSIPERYVNEFLAERYFLKMQECMNARMLILNHVFKRGSVTFAVPSADQSNHCWASYENPPYWVKSKCCGKESRGRAILARVKEII